ncbi:MAG: hypothetical protein RLY86_414 [Pseudomonadota bacterium]|jgi:acylaminoacyl-peptidase
MRRWVTGGVLAGMLMTAAVGLAAAQTAAVAGPVPPVFGDMDVFEVEYAADPQISPDGKRIVYARMSMDIMTDKAVPGLWLVDADGANHRPLLDGPVAASQPRWSPTGDRIAYVAAAAGQSQIHVRWMDTGQTALVTRTTESPGALAWSPDGKWIAFTMLVPEGPAPLAKPPAMPDGAEWAKGVTVIDDMIYRRDGQGYVEQGHVHLFVVPADGGTPRQLTRGDFNHSGTPVWTPDGGAVIIIANRNADWQTDPVDSDLWEVALADGAMRALTSRDGPDASPAISPDGRWIAYTGFDDRKMGYQNAGLYLLDRRSGQTKLLTGDLDRRVEDPAWAGNDSLLITYEDEGDVVLARIGLDGKRVELTRNVGGLVLDRPYSSGQFTVAKDGRFAYTVAGPHRPADIAVGSQGGLLSGVSLATVTRLNDDLLSQRRLGRVEEIRYKSSADGQEIQGWIVYPPDFDPAKKYPLILEIHGGPFAAYGPTFALEKQLYAAAGYVVLYTNPRGSTGYGETFANHIHHNYPGQDYDDLISGVDALIAKGIVDPDNLFVTGGSGGGTLSAWIIGKTDRFKGAVVAKPVINWTSFALTADIYNFFWQYWFDGYPWDRQAEYWRRSPLSLVGNVKTPTMVLTGEQDWRTPISETEQYYQALKLRGVDAVMVRVPDAPHTIVRRPSHQIAKVANTLAWFDKYRTDKEKPVDGGE